MASSARADTKEPIIELDECGYPAQCITVNLCFPIRTGTHILLQTKQRAVYDGYYYTGTTKKIFLHGVRQCEFRDEPTSVIEFVIAEIHKIFIFDEKNQYVDRKHRDPCVCKNFIFFPRINSDDYSKLLSVSRQCPIFEKLHESPGIMTKFIDQHEEFVVLPIGLQYFEQKTPPVWVVSSTESCWIYRMDLLGEDINFVPLDLKYILENESFRVYTLDLFGLTNALHNTKVVMKNVVDVGALDYAKNHVSYDDKTKWTLQEVIFRNLQIPKGNLAFNNDDYAKLSSYEYIRRIKNRSFWNVLTRVAVALHETANMLCSELDFTTKTN